MGANVECKLEVNRTFTDNIDSHETPSLSSQKRCLKAALEVLLEVPKLSEYRLMLWNRFSLEHLL